jgi:hypothetical protein
MAIRFHRVRHARPLRQRTLALRLAAGQPAAQAGRAAGLGPDAVEALLDDALFQRYLAAARQVQDNDPCELRQQALVLARHRVLVALIEGNLGVALFTLKEEIRGRDPVVTLVDGVMTRLKAKALNDPPPPPGPAALTGEDPRRDPARTIANAKDALIGRVLDDLVPAAAPWRQDDRRAAHAAGLIAREQIPLPRPTGSAGGPIEQPQAAQPQAAGPPGGPIEAPPGGPVGESPGEPAAAEDPGPEGPAAAGTVGPAAASPGAAGDPPADPPVAPRIAAAALADHQAARRPVRLDPSGDWRRPPAGEPSAAALAQGPLPAKVLAELAARGLSATELPAYWRERRRLQANAPRAGP